VTRRSVNVSGHVSVQSPKLSFLDFAMFYAGGVGECAVFDGWRSCECRWHTSGKFFLCVLSAFTLIYLTSLIYACYRDTTSQTERATGIASTWFLWLVIPMEVGTYESSTIVADKEWDNVSGLFSPTHFLEFLVYLYLEFSLYFETELLNLGCIFIQHITQF